MNRATHLFYEPAKEILRGFIVSWQSIPLHALRCFEAAVRLGNFRDAGLELHVTAAAVGQQVQKLERSVGRRLLRRARRGLIPSSEAMHALETLRGGLRQLAVAIETLRSPRRRILTVSVVPSLAAAWLVPRLCDFRRRHPDLDVLVHSSEEIVNLDGMDIDLGLRFGTGAYRPLITYDLFDRRVFPVCSPRLIRRRTLRLSAYELLKQPLLHTDWLPGEPERPTWEEWFNAARVSGRDVDRGLRFSDRALAIQAAVAGDGVALAHTALAGDALANGSLICPTPLVIDSPLRYSIVRTAASLGDASINDLVHWLREQANLTIKTTARIGTVTTNRSLRISSNRQNS